MSDPALEFVRRVRRDLDPGPGANRLVAAIESGRAPISVVGALAAEETRVVASDRRSFLLLAARASASPAVEFFAGLSEGESVALTMLPALAGAAGLDEAGVRGYRPRAGCQAYPAYVAWLALNADPVEVAVAVLANFAAWGRYCAAIARALRERYRLGQAACAFFDLFAVPEGPEADPSDLEQHALDAIGARLATGDTLPSAPEYGRLLQDYELMFWNTLADAG